jgi:hypothetical protein
LFLLLLLVDPFLLELFLLRKDHCLILLEVNKLYIGKLPSSSRAQTQESPPHRGGSSHRG